MLYIHEYLPVDKKYNKVLYTDYQQNRNRQKMRFISIESNISLIISKSNQTKHLLNGNISTRK